METTRDAKLSTWTERRKCAGAWSPRIAAGGTGHRNATVTLDPVLLLEHLLELLPCLAYQKHPTLLSGKGIEWVKIQVLDCLRPEVFEFCTLGRLDEESYASIHLESCTSQLMTPGLVSIGGDLTLTSSAIYLRILWTNNDPQQFYFHVGQSMELSRRLARHNCPRFRSKYPSLHYHVMELENTGSEFVVLTSNLPGESKCQSSLLNVIEMLACLVFRTLDARVLRKHLPEEVELPLTHLGLYIALPPWQSTPEKRPVNIWHGHESISSPGSSNSGSEGSSEFSLYEADIKDYHTSRRERFLNLHSSSHLSHRAYYYDVKRKENLAASAARTKGLYWEAQGSQILPLSDTPGRVCYSVLYLCWFFLSLVAQ